MTRPPPHIRGPYVDRSVGVDHSMFGPEAGHRVDNGTAVTGAFLLFLGLFFLLFPLVVIIPMMVSGESLEDAGDTMLAMSTMAGGGAVPFLGGLMIVLRVRRRSETWKVLRRAPITGPWLRGRVVELRFGERSYRRYRSVRIVHLAVMLADDGRDYPIRFRAYLRADGTGIPLGAPLDIVAARTDRRGRAAPAYLLTDARTGVQMAADGPPLDLPGAP